MTSPSPKALAALAAATLLLPLGSALAQQQQDYGFGSAKRTAGALIGILYDWKQDQKRNKIEMRREDFEHGVAAWVNNGWNEEEINKYYRVPRALYTTQLMIDTINADIAPRAFGVEKTVQPQKWMVHYKGQVAAPEDGEYRFVGNSDDFVVVAVNGKTCLVAEMPGTPMGINWHPTQAAPGGWQAVGDYLPFRAGEPVDLDIVTGESPGGQFRCRLAIQKKGGPIVPFQLTVSKETPAGGRPWRGIP
jgi:hypothetical protein